MGKRDMFIDWWLPYGCALLGRIPMLFSGTGSVIVHVMLLQIMDALPLVNSTKEKTDPNGEEWKDCKVFHDPSSGKYQ
jgi:hypothetical protein